MLGETSVYRRQLRESYIELALSFEPNFAVTLVTNQYLTTNGMRKLIKGYCARMDNVLLGKEWASAPARQRIDGTFFIEHTASNIHAHGLLRFPSGKPMGLQRISDLVWMKLCPAGSVVVESLWDDGRFADYSTKEMIKPSYDGDQIVLVRDFMSERSLQSPSSD